MIDQKQRENVEYMKHFGNMTSGDSRYTWNYIHNFLCIISIQQEDSFHQQFVPNFKEETSKELHLEHSFCMVLKLLTLWKLDQK
jgi:peptidoglycan biosynthesis protein MviN/MurJ (putative lipid II flippase)